MADATRRPPTAVHVAGRWHQGLAAIAAMFGVAALQAAMRAGVSAARLLGLGLAFLALTIVLFRTGTAVLRGRRWGWWVGVIAPGALGLVLVYATAVAPPAAVPRGTATATTVVLFAVPVVLLGSASARRFFATRGD